MPKLEKDGKKERKKESKIQIYDHVKTEKPKVLI